MGKRRTNPCYLSEDEAARDMIRTSDVVRSIAKDKQLNRNLLDDRKSKSTWYVGRVCDSCGEKL